MPFTLTMPKLSPTMEEGVIAKWHKKEGDFVKAGEVVFEVTTDKATVEYEALDEGWLRKILVKQGKSTTVNQPVAIFTEQEKESIAGYEPEGIQPELAPTPERAEEKKHKREKPAPVSKAAVFAQPTFVPEPPLKSYKFEGSGGTYEKKILASPLAKKIAKEKGLDLSSVHGSGPGGRITSKDLSRAEPSSVVSFGRKEFPEAQPGSFEEIPLSPIRKVIAKRLQESKSFIPHFYVKQAVNAEALVWLKEQLAQLELKITYNDMVVRACALALRKHPEINRGFNSANQTIIHFKTIDISIATAIEDGLITPIVRHADHKNLGEISQESRQLTEKARAGKLKEYEYKGGSFCISNLGMFGITEFTAVINPPQAAILAVGGIEDNPVIKNKRVVAGKTLVLTLSSDHRVIDGADAAKFLKTLQHLLENPVALTI